MANRPPMSPEQRAKISATLKGRPSGMTGHKHSPETIEKIRAAAKGKRTGPRKPCSPELKAKIAAAVRGYKHSEEARAKMRAAHVRRQKRAKEAAEAVEVAPTLRVLPAPAPQPAPVAAKPSPPWMQPIAQSRS